MDRVMVLLHLKSEYIHILWRFDPSSIGHCRQYTRAEAENELVYLFPDIARKGLKLNLWYEDDFAEVSRPLVNPLCMHGHATSTLSFVHAFSAVAKCASNCCTRPVGL